MKKLLKKFYFQNYLLLTQMICRQYLKPLKHFSPNIPFTNVIACANDEAPAMVGRHHGFISRLKNVALNVLTIHYIIHRQHLVAKNLNGRLNKSMRIIINVINKIKYRSRRL
jgi:hypothetical protein